MVPTRRRRREGLGGQLPSVSAVVLSVASIVLTRPAVERARPARVLVLSRSSVSAAVLSVASIADQGGHVERVARGADAAPPA